MSEANKQLVADAYANMTAGDIKSFLAVLDADIVVSEPPALPHGGVYRGLQELMGMFGKAGPVLDTSKLAVEQLTAEADRVVAVIRVPLRDGGAEAVISEHWQLREGKVVALDVFWADTSIVPSPAVA